MLRDLVQLDKLIEISAIDAKQLAKDLRSPLEDIPKLFACHVPQSRQMLRKLLNGNILCKPIMENGKAGYRFTATETFDRLLTGLTVVQEPANVFSGGHPLPLSLAPILCFTIRGVAYAA